MKPLAPNTMIQNRYLVVHLVGKGGMGEVYLAVDQRLGSAVALKRTYFADDQTLGNAFEREAKILARLRHPVLPKVSDHFLEDGEQYLVMEHISGDDLSKRLEGAKKAFPLSWVMFWADQLLDALNYLHSHEPPIIHRDIKPQNLKLTDENHIVLLDFGLSKDSAMVTRSDPAATSGSVIGYTPHFASMEQIRGTGTNARSDIYSLSATLYQLMTNTVPADALARADALIGGKEDPIIPLSDLNVEIPPVVSDVILKGIEVSQDKRFSTAVEMQKALRRAYTQTREDMSAKTMVYGMEKAPTFKSEDSVPGPDVALPEVVAAAETKDDVLPSEMPTRAQTNPEAGRIVTETPAAPAAMEATLQMGSAELEGLLKQADVKTEVLLAEDFAELQKLAETPAPVEKEETPLPTFPQEAKGETALPTFSFEASEKDGAHVPAFESDLPSGSETSPSAFAEEPAESEAAAAATAGAVSLGNIDQPASPEFFTSPNVKAEVGKSASPAADQQAKPVPPQARTSSSKAALMLGGLAAVFILILGAAGAGWFVYNNYYAVSEPTPTPLPSVEVAPSPEPTVETFASSDTNTDSNSATVSDANSNTADNRDVTVSATPVATPGPFSTKPTPQTITKNVSNTNKAPSTPVAKVTPKPKPNDNRTVILQ